MRAKTVNLPSWEELYEILPDSMKKIFLRLQQIREDPRYHPEQNTLEHVKIVYERALKSKDPDLIMTALFHDFGKALTAVKNEKGYFSSHGHEQVSVKLIDLPLYNKFIKDFGANPETVSWLISNHMKIHRFHEMRPFKQKILLDDPNFNKLEAFGIIDTMN